jgi:transcriptional regulator with XRE-family HTH domain
MEALAASGLSQAAFASRLGTSASRMSTYLRGEVTPSASLLIRAQRLGLTVGHKV